MEILGTVVCEHKVGNAAILHTEMHRHYPTGRQAALVSSACASTLTSQGSQVPAASSMRQSLLRSRWRQLRASDRQLPTELGDQPASRSAGRTAALMHHVERKAELAPAVLGDIEPLQPTGGHMRVDQMRRPLPRNGVRYQSAEGAIVIAPTAALGVAIEFTSLAGQ
jgi:hypothetical protein